MHIQIIEKHTSNYPNPISFKVGDKLSIGIRDDEFEGWVRAKTEDGNEGWAPEQYIDMNSTPEVATQNYSANELNTEVGEILETIHSLNEWLWVKNSAGQLGWVPRKTTKCV